MVNDYQVRVMTFRNNNHIGFDLVATNSNSDSAFNNLTVEEATQIATALLAAVDQVNNR